MGLPIRTRLTLISAVLIAAVLLGLGAFLYLRLEADLRDAVDAGLRSRAAVLLDRAGGLTGSGLADHDEAFAQLLAADGRIIETSPGLAGPLISGAETGAVSAVTIVERVVDAAEEPIPARLLLAPAGDGTVLVVGASVEDQHDALARLLALLVIGGPVAIGLASAVGWGVAGAALRPVERLRREAEAVSAIEPGRRLAVPGTGDELTRLAESLNRMLTRLEDAVARERRFVADASHELRTPLANLRAEVDLALLRSRTPDELTAALRSTGEEAERLSRLAEDLLVLARAADGRLPLRRVPTDLTELVAQSVAGFAGRAAAQGVSIHPPRGPVVRGSIDPDRIRQAVGNLVDNALRLARPGGAVTATVREADGALLIEVTDDGPGFDDAFLPRLGEPFSRPDAARPRAKGGTGLGLAIVRAVVEAHGGMLDAGNLPAGGARVTIRIPA